MNLRAWFRDDEEKRERERLRRLVQTRPRARQQHYVFAHKLLPQIAFDFGAASVLMLFDGDKALDFLNRLWSDCGEGCEGRDLVASDGRSAGLSVLARRTAGGDLIALISLPRPQVAPEAFFVALMCDAVADPEDESDDAQEVWRLVVRSTPVRVFTLELSQDEQGGEGTVFGEWTREGKHLNMGSGPAPSAEAFFDFLLASDHAFPRPQASFDPNRAEQVSESE